MAEKELNLKQKRLKYYVYFLIDSLTNQIFYVGKGQGKRIFAHISYYKCGNIDNPFKYERIANIIKSGGKVESEIFVDNLSEQEALEIEKFMIRYIGIDNLTNISSGQNTERQKAMVMLDRIIPLDIWCNIEKRTQSDIDLYNFVVSGFKQVACYE
jgi:hypothetical protein